MYVMKLATHGIIFTKLFSENGGARIEVTALNTRLYATVHDSKTLNYQADSIRMMLPPPLRPPLSEVVTVLRTLLKVDTHEPDTTSQA